MIAFALALSFAAADVPTVPAMRNIARPFAVWTAPEDRIRLDLYRDRACMITFNTSERGDSVLCRWHESDGRLTVIMPGPISGLGYDWQSRVAEFRYGEGNVLQFVEDPRIELRRSR